MGELLRPPAHRGPLIASGAVVLAIGVALAEVRMEDEWGPGWHLLITGSLAALFIWLGLQESGEGGRPRAHESVLLVAGLLALLVALIWLADVLGVEDVGPGTAVWILLAEGAAATACSMRRGSAISSFIAALAFGGAFIAAADWIFDIERAAVRWLLLVTALAFVITSLILRGGRPRNSELLVSAAGLAILLIPVMEVVQGLFFFFAGTAPSLPGFWELVVLAAGCGLLAYSAADRAPGPAYLGLANLGLFVGLNADDDSLKWWPFTLIVLGLLALAAGLRPRSPLPPEPDAYSAHDLPPSVRATDEEVTVRVHEP